MFTAPIARAARTLRRALSKRSDQVGELARRSAPLQLIDVREQRGIGRRVASFLNSSASSRRSPSTSGRKVLDPAVACQQRWRRPSGRCRRCRDSRPRCRRPARDSPESTRDRLRTSRAHRRRRGSPCSCGRPARRDPPERTAPGPCPASRCTPSERARRWKPDRRRRPARRRPRARPWARRRRPSPPGLLERMKLRPQRRIDAVAGLVAGPELVTERLDDMVGGNAKMRGALLDHLQDGVEHARDGREGLVLSLVESAQAIEMAEELVGAVDEMNDHAGVVVSGKGGILDAGAAKIH